MQKTKAYLHVDKIISDPPQLVHCAVCDPAQTEWWGERIFG